MEEKTVIEGKFHKKNPIVIALLILGFIGFIVAFITAIYADKYMGHGVFYQYYFGFYGTAAAYIHYGAYIFFILAVPFYFFMNRCSLTITDKRVYGKASFGRRVDLPMNQVSSVGLGFANSVAVATSSGKIKFWLLTNKDEIHGALSDLLIEQQKSESRPIEIKQSNADELKKYKELLDSEIITQEEFDAKKKQILGL